MARSNDGFKIAEKDWRFADRGILRNETVGLPDLKLQICCVTTNFLRSQEKQALASLKKIRPFQHIQNLEETSKISGEKTGTVQNSLIRRLDSCSRTGLTRTPLFIHYLYGYTPSSFPKRLDRFNKLGKSRKVRTIAISTLLFLIFFTVIAFSFCLLISRRQSQNLANSLAPVSIEAVTLILIRWKLL